MESNVLPLFSNAGLVTRSSKCFCVILVIFKVRKAALPLPGHILQAGQIVGSGFCGWIDVQVPLLEALPGKERHPSGIPNSGSGGVS